MGSTASTKDCTPAVCESESSTSETFVKTVRTVGYALILATGKPDNVPWLARFESSSLADVSDDWGVKVSKSDLACHCATDRRVY